MELPQWSAYPALPSPLSTPMFSSPPHECAYLPDRQTIVRAFHAGLIPTELYRELMDAGFRRSGHIIYQPVCQGCRQCIPLRVLVDEFQPSKSQRRCLRRKADLTMTVDAPIPTEEKFLLYQKYQSLRHDREEATDWASFEEFLYKSPVDSAEFIYRDATGKLSGIGLCDIGHTWLSSVYFYFDPALADRSLGTLGALREIEFARQHRRIHYYLGYWVRDSRKMQYKAAFRPHELLGLDGTWRLGDFAD